MNTVAHPSPRQMFSGSPVFEAGYVAFMKKVFEQDIRAVVLVETATSKSIVMAGSIRIRLSKKTGHIHQEKRVLGSNTWTQATSALSSFWAGNKEIADWVVAGWWLQLQESMPTAEECYGNGFPAKYADIRKSYVDVGRAQKALWEQFMQRAAERRLGKASSRKAATYTVVGALWNFLVDRDTLRLCHAYFGRKANFADYNFTIEHRASLQQYSRETPNLLRLIGAYLQSDAWKQCEEKTIPSDVLVRARTALFAGQSTKSGGADVVLSPAGWRYLAGCSRAVVEQVWNEVSNTDKPQVIVSLNRLAATGERHSLSFIKWAIRNLVHMDDSYLGTPLSAAANDNIVRFLRQAGLQAEKARKKYQLKSFLAGDLALCLDWFGTSMRRPAGVRRTLRDRQELVPLQKNATWSSIMRAQQQWHATRAAREAAQRALDRAAFEEEQARLDAMEWHSALTAHELSDVQVTPLTTGAMLRVEGEEMDHCVGDYVRTCAGGHSRIFALKHGKERATLEISVTNSKSWKVRQVFGPENTRVSPTLQAASKTIAKAYQIAVAQEKSPKALAA